MTTVVNHTCAAWPCPICNPQLALQSPGPVTVAPKGCICPPTSEQTCMAEDCPRKTKFVSAIGPITKIEDK